MGFVRPSVAVKAGGCDRERTHIMGCSERLYPLRGPNRTTQQPLTRARIGSPSRGASELQLRYAGEMILNSGRCSTNLIAISVVISDLFGNVGTTPTAVSQIFVNLLLLSGDINPNPGPLRVLQINCRSIRAQGRAQALALLARQTRADALLLSETWLQSTHSSPHIRGYGVINQSDQRDDSTGGGVITYVRLGISTQDEGTYCGEKVEIAHYRVCLGAKGRPVAISDFYISPDVAKTFEWNGLFPDEALLFGDCNLHGSWDPCRYESSASRLEDFLESTGRIVINDGSPTLITRSGPAAVDITAIPAGMVAETS